MPTAPNTHELYWYCLCYII